MNRVEQRADYEHYEHYEHLENINIMNIMNVINIMNIRNIMNIMNIKIIMAMAGTILVVYSEGCSFSFVLDHYHFKDTQPTDPIAAAH